MPVVLALGDGALVCAIDKEVLVYDSHAYDEDIERWLREAGIDVDLSSP